MAFNKTQVLTENLDVILIALSLRKSKKLPTHNEQIKLKQYKGFGGIKEVLFDRQLVGGWSTESLKIKPLIDQLFTVLSNEIDSVALIASLKNSVITSFYTEKKIIDAFSEVLVANNIAINSYVDPSAGVGNFFESLSANMVIKKSLQLEKDILTALILNPLVKLAGGESYNVAFENTGKDSYIGINDADLIASNIPFGDIRVFDNDYYSSKILAKRLSLNKIHNYFMIRSLDYLKEGGIMAHIMPYGLLNTSSNQMTRRYIFSNADLISAVKLPQNTFESSGTAAGADFLIVKKNSNKGYLSVDEQLIIQITEGDYSTNKYFEKYPNKVIADSIIEGTDQYGKQALEYYHSGGINAIYLGIKGVLSSDFLLNYAINTKKKLKNEAIMAANKANNGQMNLFAMFDPPSHAALPIISNTVKPVENVEKYIDLDDIILGVDTNGAIIKHNDQLYRLELLKNRAVLVTLDEALRDQIYACLNIKECYEALYHHEFANSSDFTQKRVEINEAYSKYVAQYGQFNLPIDNNEFATAYPQFNILLSLEVYNEQTKGYNKADILHKNIFNNDKQDYTLIEAFNSVLNKTGFAHLSLIAAKANVPEAEAEKELLAKKLIAFNPVKNVYAAYASVISGNILAKIKYINDNENALKASLGHSFYRVENVLNELIIAKPANIPFYDLDINLGELWLPEVIYNDFLNSLLKTNNEVTVKLFPNSGKFIVNSGFTYGNNYVETVYAVEPTDSHKLSGVAVFEHALLDELPDITMTVGYDINDKPIKVKDTVAIKEVSAKMDEIKSKFKDFVSNLDDTVKQKLEKLYNGLFNCNIKPVHNGEHLELVDLNLKNLGFNSLYGSQKDAVWMVMQNGGGIIDHQVGTGKTVTMCVAAHEMKRLGMVNKPMIIGLKANTKAIADTYKLAYPLDKILYSGDTDFSKKRRDQVYNSIKNNDYACIIMTHEQFSAICQNKDIMKEVIDDEIINIIKDLDWMIKAGDVKDSSRIRAGLEKRINNLKASCLKLLQTQIDRKSSSLDFSQMGIDHIFVDESHMFKNLSFTTRHKNVAGLGQQVGSYRAFDMLCAIRTIQKNTGKDLGATFLSGTTLSNSVNELYALFKYLRPKELKRLKCENFDAWIGTFGEKRTDFEISVVGNVILKERYRTFIKVPELSNLYAEITNHKTAKDVGIFPPTMATKLIMVPQTPDQEDYTLRLQDFAKSGNGDIVFRKKPMSDNDIKAKMLIATNLSAQMAIDIRLIDANFEDNVGNKISVMCNKILSTYQEYNYCKATQLVFCDVGTPKSKNEFNVYQEIKRKLVEGGINEKEIAFIQSAEASEAKQKLIDKTNKGQIRVLLGSTATLGTGVNAQQKIIALHHLDIPYKPSEMEQREGRGGRTGNIVAATYNNNQVFNFVYAVEKTLDAYKFNLLANKQLFINQVKSAQVGIRRIDEGAMDESNGVSYLEFMAITSGNNDILEKSKLENKILSLESRKTMLANDIKASLRKLGDIDSFILNNESTKEKLIKDKASLEAIGYTFGQTVKDAEGYQTLDNIAITSKEDFVKVINDGLANNNIGILGLVKYNGFVLVVDTNKAVFIENSINGGLFSEGNTKTVFSKNVFVESLQTGQIYNFNHGRLGETEGVMLNFLHNSLKNIAANIESCSTNISKLHCNKADLIEFSQTVFGKEAELNELKLNLKILEKNILSSTNAANAANTNVNIPKFKDGRRNKSI